MFSFLEMMGNHDSRKIANYNKGGVFVDTCAVNDSEEPYETAVAHKEYIAAN